MYDSPTSRSALDFGTQFRTRDRCWYARSQQSGFTLLELLLVLVLIGIGTAITANRLSSMRNNSTIDLAVARLRDAARSAQLLAANDSLCVRLHVDTERCLARIEPLDTVTGLVLRNKTAPPISLRNGEEELTIEFRSSDGIPNGFDTIDILFYPDRTCEPAGKIIVTNSERFATVHLAASAALPTNTPSRDLNDRTYAEERLP